MFYRSRTVSDASNQRHNVAINIHSLQATMKRRAKTTEMNWVGLGSEGVLEQCPHSAEYAFRNDNPRFKYFFKRELLSADDPIGALSPSKDTCGTFVFRQSR